MVSEDHWNSEKKDDKNQLEEEELKVETERVIIVDGVTKARTTALRALQPENESTFPVLQVAMRKYRFVRGTTFNELQHLLELEPVLLCTRT